MKKVLHIAQSIQGGVETYFREIIVHSEGHYEQMLITPENEQLEQFCRIHNVKHYVVNMRRNINLINDFTSFMKLCKILKKEKPDLVHVHSAKAGILGRAACSFFKYKSVYTPHGVSYLSFSGFRRIILMSIEVFFKRFTKAILAVSNSEASRLIFEMGYDAKSVYVVPNFITTKESLPKRVFYPDKKIIKVGTMARLTPQKNPLLFIEIANAVVESLPNIEFFMLGSGLHGHLETEVYERINAYKLENKVHILQWTTFDNTEDYLNDLDIFMLTSVFEGLPISLLEAMNAGLPCVVSKCDGCNDVIQNAVNGFSCMTVDEFSSAIKNVISNQKLYNEISLKAKVYVEKYHSSAVNVASVHRVYETVMNN